MSPTLQSCAGPPVSTTLLYADQIVLSPRRINTAQIYHVCALYQPHIHTSLQKPSEQVFMSSPRWIKTWRHEEGCYKVCSLWEHWGAAAPLFIKKGPVDTHGPVNVATNPSASLPAENSAPHHCSGAGVSGGPLPAFPCKASKHKMCAGDVAHPEPPLDGFVLSETLRGYVA